MNSYKDVLMFRSLIISIIKPKRIEYSILYAYSISPLLRADLSFKD